VITDFRTARSIDLPRDATVVVGAGAAGLAVSLGLADRGHEVVLLESGGDVRDRGSIGDSAGLNEGVSEEQYVSGLRDGRARVLGGATQLWHGQCMRLFDIDLQERPWVAGSGWPIDHAELDGAYTEAERWFEVSGRGYGEERWTEFTALPPLQWDPDRLLHAFTEYTPQPYLGTKHRSRLEQDRNVHVVLHATVARVRVHGGRTTGVDVLDGTGRTATISARTVIVAGGSIENARILQLSDENGVGLGLGRENTGRYLQDHPIIKTAEVVVPDRSALQDRYGLFWRNGRRAFPKIRLAPGAQARHALLDAAAVFDFEHDRPSVAAAERMLSAFRGGPRPLHPLHDAALAVGATPDVLRALYRRNVRGLHSYGGRPSRIALEIWVEQAPTKDRYVTLADTRDPLGLRQASVRWTCDAEELETSRQMTRWIGADLERLGIARLRELPAMQDDDAWRETVRDGFHPAGTTRMADSPRDGVVDRDLQVHGVPGLYVVGGSVFPTSGYANPTLTIVALALRLAAHVAGARSRLVTTPA
jgi:choline dehydrogenase-like flavoprotein